MEDRESLRILYVKDKENRITKTMNDRIVIEAVLIQYNREHYQQAYHMKAFQNLICNELKEDWMRDRILKRQLQTEDYEDPNVYDFLLLLKQPQKWVQ